ncbi:hypothetical protein VTN77DRAFT_8310 [Rasamsonia byssochlamydoides]|uniref:uncharacterized protein n=1 Tax=Rasamsonia byssochlamydoides TaxID=89139 RepID=UPI0037424565
MLGPRSLTCLPKSRCFNFSNCFKVNSHANTFISTTHAPTNGRYLQLRSRQLRTRKYIPLMPNDTEQDPYQRANKRRRISTAAAPHEFAPTMAQTEEQIKQPLPEIELTPIENTIKTLLLDVKEYIRQKDEAEGGGRAGEEMELRFTGGWVRDKLLGVNSHDIDVAISTMTGYQFGMALKEYLDVPENLEKYKRDSQSSELKEAIVSLHKIEANPEKSKHLETVTTKIFGMDIDLVNLRKETYSEDSRNPQMEFGTAVEDALRRDATVNALFYNLNHSKLEDLTGKGLDDMKNKLIRTPLEPYQTFKDDPLRVLRLIRFASRLGYHIVEDAQDAMQNEDIKHALRLKISKERICIEVEKMLRGPDPRVALNYIDKLGLYSTIFANHRDEVGVDTSSWSLAYNALDRVLNTPDDDEIASATRHVRDLLVRDASEKYYAWVVTAFSPWASVPARPQEKGEKKPPPPRAAEVSRDSLKSDNKTMGILSDAATHFRAVSDLKASFIAGSIPGTGSEIRQHMGLSIRSWKKDWRMCVIMGILQEIMGGAEFPRVIREYDEFLSYVAKENLLEVDSLRPIVNGGEIKNALGASSGPWMSAAMEMVIRWQLLHPEISDKEKALEELRNRRAELGI